MELYSKILGVFNLNNICVEIESPLSQYPNQKKRGGEGRGEEERGGERRGEDGRGWERRGEEGRGENRG